MIAVQESGGMNIRQRKPVKKVARFRDVYRLGELICKGTQGDVYRAHDRKDSDRAVAVKIVDRKDLTKEEEEQVLREVAIMRDLEDVETANSVVDFFASSKRFYIVQNLAKGGDIFDWVVGNGRYTEEEAREVAIKLLTTIQETHSRGYIHRDLKPENILLADKESNTSILVGDFGYADVYDPSHPPTTKCGTPAYTAPEIIFDDSYTQAADLWSLGCILYMILSGRPAFYGTDTRDLLQRIRIGKYSFRDEDWDHISYECMECIMGLLTVDPERRWTTKQALASDWLSSGLSQ
jgi:serine/threonine protein kinase